MNRQWESDPTAEFTRRPDEAVWEPEDSWCGNERQGSGKLTDGGGAVAGRSTTDTFRLPLSENVRSTADNRLVVLPGPPERSK